MKTNYSAKIYMLNSSSMSAKEQVSLEFSILYMSLNICSYFELSFIILRCYECAGLVLLLRKRDGRCDN